MSFRSRFFSAFLVVVMLCLVLYQGLLAENGAAGNVPEVLGGKETVYFWPPDMNSRLIGKDPDAGKDGGQEEKGTTGDEMVGWHH